ncbi:hypothetical protein CTI12_AA334210 [Artemisia annua]|uniref:Glabrous enhancer-binding protein-like DBD domain-containing protein n=1 Tax=Artemisia annua TaxID=35608 RepID=A0A2U1MXC3_ARTAN|nr:hypothetical protein CTI12_AA334210 [Artemisia annua]
MDSPNQPPHPQIPIQQPTPISSFPPSGKLPIKRKTPPTPNPTSKHPRIWTEQDEIQLLHNLLDPSSQPSNGLSHLFTKSQLSDKLRRLRKKFRNVSTKIENGWDQSLVSPHDRKLYDLMKHLWEPKNEPSYHNRTFNEYNESNNDCEEANLVAVLALPSFVQKADNCVNNGARNDNVVKGGMKALSEVVDESLNVIRKRMKSDVGRLAGVEKEVQFEKRWRDQRMAEFEVLAKRLKLIMENSLVGGK